MMLPLTEVHQHYPGPVEQHLDKQVEVGGHSLAAGLYLVLPVVLLFSMYGLIFSIFLCSIISFTFWIICAPF